MKMKPEIRRSGALLVAAIAVLSFGCSENGADEESTAASVALDPYAGEFTVFRSESGVVGHDKARISIVRTAINPPKYGLVFYQTQGEKKGQGLVCDDASQPEIATGEVTDALFGCEQVANNVRESLTVDYSGSAFCESKRVVAAEKDIKTIDGKNPIATDSECSDAGFGGDKECICYDVTHVNATTGEIIIDMFVPPDNGSGSGGGTGNN